MLISIKASEILAQQDTQALKEIVQEATRIIQSREMDGSLAVSAEELHMAMAGNKIGAIKRYRTRTGAWLRDSLFAINQALEAAGHGPVANF